MIGAGGGMIGAGGVQSAPEVAAAATPALAVVVLEDNRCDGVYNTMPFSVASTNLGLPLRNSGLLVVLVAAVAALVAGVGQGVVVAAGCRAAVWASEALVLE